MTVRGALGGRTAAVVLALVALSLLVWFVGPLVAVAGRAPLVGIAARLWTIGAMVLLALAFAGVRALLARRREARLLAALAGEDGGSDEDEAIAEERAALGDKMEAAIATLRSRSAARGRDGRFVYELPWYAIVGPPGAGKTTLLANSGLEFPLEETHGRHSVKGVGGTRDCDWWFTDDAVLLDTAGRYATQDSDAALDAGGWQAFLTLLKDVRPRRPLNGVLVALSVQDVAGADAEALDALARRLRGRVDELREALGIVPPVYLLFTKCDLLAGFDAFFGADDAAAREQVWGFTRPAPGERADDRESSFSDGLDALVARLRGQTLERLHAEHGVERREAIYTFPLQFAALIGSAKGFVERFAARSRLVDDVLLRGVYFTSATQTGGVLDQVIARVAAGVGLPPAESAAPATAGRSHFVRRLLADVVFPEAGLAGTDRRTERRLALVQRGAIAGVSVALAGLLALWGGGWFAERARLERVEARAAELDRALSALSPASLDLVETTRVLELARRLGEPADDGGGALPRLLGGFGASGSVERLADAKYEALLLDVLLPRLTTRLEHRLAAESEDDDFLFEGLKTYLMIGDPTRFDAASVIGWFRYDVAANLPPATSPATREALLGHVERLFAEPPVPLPRPLDATLVERLRQIAARLPLEQRAWARLKGGARESLRDTLTLSDVAPELPRLFTLEGDVPLDRAVPRLYTTRGYREDFLPLVDGVAARLADERWVLGERFVAGDVDESSLDAAVRRLYEEEYVATWRGVLDGLRLRPVDGLDGAARVIARLTASDSPLAAFLREAARQTAPLAALEASLDGADDAGDGATPGADAGGGDDGGVAAARRAAELAALLGPRDTAPIAAGEAPEDRVAARFASLHALVASGGGPSPLEGALAELAGLNTQLLAMAAGGGAGDPALGRELAAGLQALGFRTERLAEPLASIVESLAGDIRDAAGSGLCRQLETAWRSEVLPFWTRAIRGRYPVFRRALADVALADFAAFFGPGGRLQTFADARLGPLVTRTPGRWSWSGNGASCLAEETLRQLALGDDIRDTFFAGGGQTPSFAFDLVPSAIAVDPAITLLQLQVGTARVDYFHGPVAGSTSFVWPPPDGALQASLRVEPVVPGGSSGLVTTGPWAILRLFEQGARARRDGGLGIDYSFSGRAVSLGFATSSFNPLDSVALRNFRAPESL